MQETFKWQRSNCVWAQLVSQDTSAPVSEIPFSLEFSQGSLPRRQLPVLSQYLRAYLVGSSWCCVT